VSHAAALLAASLAGGASHAQTAADRAEAARQGETIQRETQERLRREVDAARGARPDPGGLDPKSFMPELHVPTAGRACSEITSVSIEGAPHLPRTVRDHVQSKYSGRCVGVTEIEQILGAITAEYVRRGYITTRAYLPSQDLSTGLLRIQVVEGVIERIVVSDGGSGSMRVANAFPTGPGELLNLRDLEQGLEQINRLSSNNAQLDIQPGGEAGASTVVIRNTAGPRLRSTLSMDNHGSVSTGRNQAGLSLAADNLLGLNEFAVLTHRQSVPNDREARSSVSDNVSVYVPFGYSTLSLSASRSTYATMIAVPSGLQLRSNGSSGSYSTRLEHVTYRDQASRLTLSGAFTSKETENYLAGEYLAVSSRRLSVLDLAAGGSTALLGGVFSAELGISKGLAVAGAQVDMPDLPDYAPRAQFTKLPYAASFLRGFKLGDGEFTFSSQLVGQRSDVTLHGSERIAIGGLYSVRGFNSSSLSGDSGYYVRNELSARYVFGIAAQAVAARAYAALDTGRVWGAVPGGFDGRLTGATVGVVLSMSGVSLDVSVAAPISQPPFLPREAPQLWARLSYSL
jgi:hemolysin activation/secretion protein